MARRSRAPAMKLVVVAVGRLKDGAERTLSARYEERIAASSRAIGFSGFRTVEIGESRARTAPLRSDEEAAALIRKTSDATFRFVLDERGAAITSRKFAERLGGLQDAGERDVAFLIGGPDGHGEAARASASQLLSLGPMTLPHGLARIVLLEQIYRGLTILSGHPYHRD